MPEQGLRRWLSAASPMLNSLDEGVYAVDPEGRIRFLNPAAERVLGWARTELLGREACETIHARHGDGAGPPASGCPLLAAMRSGRTHCGDGATFARKDGTGLTVTYTSSPLVIGGRVAGAVVTFQDVMQRRRSEEALRRSEARFRMIFEGAALGICLGVKTGVAAEANPAMAQMLGYSADELRHIHFSAYTHPDDAEADSRLYEELAEGKRERYQMEKRYVRKDGQVRWGRLTMSLVRDERGEPEATIAMVEDVTERRQAEEERARLLAAEREARAQAEEAVRARDDFLAVAAHELKTPITTLRGYAEMLLGVWDLGGVEAWRALEAIHRQSVKLTRLVEQLLDVSRIETGTLALEPAPRELVGLVEGVVEDARTREPRHPIALSARGPINVVVDALRLEQVLTNLLDNAAKYSPEGEPIEVEVCALKAGRVRISVRDRGAGVGVEHRERIFERLYRAQGESYLPGLGLGLYVSRQIVELHGGRLEAEFPEDGGSRFVVELPISSGEGG